MATKATLDSNVHGTSVGADGNIVHISVDESPAASSPGRTDDNYEDPEEGKICP